MIERQRTFDVEQVEKIFRQSEIRPTEFRSREDGHAFRRHIGISNAHMASRGERVRNGEVMAITAFITNQDAFLAAVELLNSDPGRAALVKLDAGHNGMRAGITSCAKTPTRVRYLRGEAVATMPSYWFRMLLDRNGIEPYGLHVQTFYPLIEPDAEIRAWVKNSNESGGEQRVFPFPLGRQS
jgi:hypothetical protein